MWRALRWCEEDAGQQTALAPPAAVGVRRRYGVAAIVVLAAVVGAAWWSMRPSGPPVNAQPVIVLMDSPLPGRVYDPRTASQGGTNADDVTDVLRALPVAIRKENTSAVWHREEQVVFENPDLIISHLSCFVDERVANGDAGVAEHLSDVADTGCFCSLRMSRRATRAPNSSSIRERSLPGRAAKPSGWPTRRPICRSCVDGCTH